MKSSADPASTTFAEMAGTYRRRVVPIKENWKFRQADEPEAEFLDTAGFPTEIHRDLLSHGLIPDPFLDKNENDVQWIGEKSWEYRTTFSVPITDLEKTVIVFEGLDTYATVKLNGQKILQTSNTFTPYRANVTGKLIAGGQNTLSILFESTFLIGKKLVEKDPKHFWGCWNGDPSRLAVRKAQYHYGWDWGPTLLTCGPWKPIYVELFNSRISDLTSSTFLEESLGSAEIRARVEIDGTVDRVAFELALNGKCIARNSQSIESSSCAETIFRTSNPRLWYPRRYGEQPLYELSATIFKNNQTLDVSRKKFGLRKAKVIQHTLEDAPGTSFIFEINNLPIFCGGSSWIPTHNFQTALDEGIYRDWIRMAADGNQDMLRVWGGGIYEQDAFYEACDELGILVWQDFMFACGNYPANHDFLESVHQEAIANVKRLRHHPCIVLWAGNNEDYQYRESENLEYDPDDKNSENWLKTSFPARYIYEKLLPDVMKTLSPDTYYHFGSPYGGKTSGDPTVGDIHQWNMWHGTQEEYQVLDQLSGRFVSEFGMEAYPSMRTLDGVLTGTSKQIERHPQSSTIEFHNKAAGSSRRLALYLAENIKYDLQPFERYTYCTQLIQSEAISTAFRLWKRLWKGPGREYCAGALVWQMNDCWPGISWSMVDHYLRPKLGYFALKREMASVTIGMKRTVRTIPRDKYTRAYTKTEHHLEVWLCNLSLEDLTIDIAFTVNILSVPKTTIGGTTIQVIKDSLPDQTLRNIPIPANRSTELTSFLIPDSPPDGRKASQTIVSAVVTSSSSSFHPNKQHQHIIARAINWPEPLKHVHLPRPADLRVTLTPLSPTEADAACQVRTRTPCPSHHHHRPPTATAGAEAVPHMISLTSDVPLKGIQWDFDFSSPPTNSNADDNNNNEREAAGGGGQRSKELVFDDEGFDVMADETVRVLVWGMGQGGDGGGGGKEGKWRIRHL